MQIEQIILRPSEDVILVQHRDCAGRAGTVVVKTAALDEKVAAGLAVFLGDCQSRLPAEPEKPPQAEVEQEIAELEYRLEHLRKSIGQAVPVEVVVGETRPIEP